MTTAVLQRQLPVSISFTILAFTNATRAIGAEANVGIG